MAQYSDSKTLLLSGQVGSALAEGPNGAVVVTVLAQDLFDDLPVTGWGGVGLGHLPSLAAAQRA